ncbi:MAG: hypothetical protein Q4C06_05465 [Bacillota bacterium]|nr:hypothetical protein [Bacillota bacterium]
MNGNPLVPFERNRYYAGKMLTSADFAAEQGYVNDKRRFLNTLVFGSGIVCGCNVYSLDDLSIFIESGLAIDSLGREIVIDSSVVKKLSAIHGFEAIRSNHVTLCLKYKEEQVHPVYSVNRQGSSSEYEYNRIQEGYDLFLMDSEDAKNYFEMESEFLTRGVLYQDEHYEIQLILPATVCRNRYAKLQLKATKLSSEDLRFSYEGKLQTPSFLTEAGGHDLNISLSNMRLMEGESISQEYWVFVQDTMTTETSLILKKESVRVCDVAKTMDEDFTMKVMISDVNPRALVNRELGKISLELQSMGNTQDFIPLADISLIRTEGAYIIDYIKERDVKKYIETPAQSTIRSEYLDYFRGTERLGVDLKNNGMEKPSYDRNLFDDFKVQIATGTMEIPVGGKAKAGEIFYSGEVMHGLGAGSVYVEIGQEFMDEDRVKGASTKSTIFGNSNLFAQSGKQLPRLEQAVKVLNDKGSFIAAISFAEETDCLMLSFRWVAVKFANNDMLDMNEGVEKQWIEAETPTVVLGTREEYFFGVRFHEMDKCSVGYEVTEEDGGQISVDGVYTAPNKEGVFEIKIYCIDRPFICTYAYAIVKKK